MQRAINSHKGISGCPQFVRPSFKQSALPHCCFFSPPPFRPAHFNQPGPRPPSHPAQSQMKATSPTPEPNSISYGNSNSSRNMPPAFSAIFSAATTLPPPLLRRHHRPSRNSHLFPITQPLLTAPLNTLHRSLAASFAQPRKQLLELPLVPWPFRVSKASCTASATPQATARASVALEM